MPGVLASEVVQAAMPAIKALQADMPPGWTGKSWACTTGVAQAYAPAVASQRERARLAFDSVQSRLLVDLGMTRSGRPRVVFPGGSVEASVAAAIGDAIANVAANGTSALRLMLTPTQLEALRQAPGASALDRVKVEALVFAGGARARTREDAIGRWCAQLRRPLPQLGPQPEPPPTSPPPPSSVDLEGTLVKIVDEKPK